MPRRVSLLLILVTISNSNCFLASNGVKLRPAGNATVGACIPHERDALLAFKKGITSDLAGLLDSWQVGAHGEQDCCRWRGVRCSNWTGHVLKLRLCSDFNEPILAPLVGQISPSLLSLEYLEHLDLSGNSLQGSDGHIPKFLGSLKNLKYLDLSSIPFSGQVPPHIGNLTNLQYLDLSSTGDTHSKDISWITHLHSLEYLCLSGVNFSTIVDWPRAVNMIPSLRVLELSGSSLMSANQSLTHLNLTNLKKLDLSYNYFDHLIASSWFWNITRLKYLDLSWTGLYGLLPHEIEGMTYLQHLDISQSFDSTHKCTMTASLRNLCNLEFLNMESKLLDGDIIELLENLPRCSSNRLRELRLSHNNISGVLPTTMGHLTILKHLDLSKNNIRGILPKWMGQLTRLEFLGLSDNNIRGVIPSWIGKLTRLNFLAMARNHNISGVLPNEMGQLTRLDILDLASNNITGPLPSFIGHFISLSYLDLSYNHLTGHVPYEIGMLSNVSYLNINTNDLDGVITEEHFASMENLNWIDMSSNNFKFEISPEWQPPFSLMEGHFASCQMGPRFPSWLKWMVDIDKLDISNTSLNDKLPDWFCNTFSKVTYLSMANNQVHGELPANMENISSLERLFLGSNQFTGQIPPMPISLITLDLSRNYFSGPLL